MLLFQNFKSKLNYKINYLKEHRYPQPFLLTKGSIPSSALMGLEANSQFSLFLLYD